MSNFRTHIQSQSVESEGVSP